MNREVQTGMRLGWSAILLVLLLSPGMIWGQTVPAAPAPPAPAVGAAPPGPRVTAMPMAPRSERAYLGVGVADISSQRARELKLAEERGVEVTKVIEGSPAAGAGLKEGDVLLEYNGQRVEGTEQFMRLVRETPPGRQVKLLVSRGGGALTLTPTLTARKGSGGLYGVTIDLKDVEKELDKLRDLGKDIRIQIPDIPRPQMTWRSRALGVEAESLADSQLAEYFGVKEGVLVRNVLEGSAAAKAGVKAGDVILRLDDRKVTTPGEISSLLRGLESKKTVNLTVMRRLKEMTIPVTIDDSAWNPAGAAVFTAG